MQVVGRAAARPGRRALPSRERPRRATNAACCDPADRATVVPRGIDLDALPGPAPTGRPSAPGTGPLVVNVARLVPEKAQHLLVEAFAAARPQLPGAQLVIIGAGGRAEPAVRAAVVSAVERHGLGDAVRLLGFRDDARALVAAADVFAFSSLSEGSPGAVLEALALGTPVAAFDIPPVADLTGGGRYARLAPAGDAAALGRAIVPRPTGRRPRGWTPGLPAVRPRDGGRSPGGRCSRPGRRRRPPRCDDARPRCLRHLHRHRDGLGRGAPAGRTAGRLRRRAGRHPRRPSTLERHGIAATWAIVGHLFLDRCDRPAGPTPRSCGPTSAGSTATGSTSIPAPRSPTRRTATAATWSKPCGPAPCPRRSAATRSPTSWRVIRAAAGRRSPPTWPPAGAGGRRAAAVLRLPPQLGRPR